MNIFTLIGRLCDDPKVKELDDNKKICNFTIAVKPPYKNDDGIYETEFYPTSVWNNVAELTAEYCKKGDLIALKGRLKSKDNKISIITEKISFLSSKITKDDIVEEKDIKM